MYRNDGTSKKKLYRIDWNGGSINQSRFLNDYFWTLTRDSRTESLNKQKTTPIQSLSGTRFCYTTNHMSIIYTYDNEPIF